MNLEYQSFMARIRESEPEPEWHISTAVRLMLVYIVLRMASLFFVATLMDPASIQTGMLSPLISNSAYVLAGLLIVAFIWLSLRRQLGGAFLEGMRFTPYRTPAIILVLVALGAAITIDFVPLAFETIGLPLTLLGLQGADRAAWAVAIALAVGAGPLVDALLFQGVIYPVFAALQGNVRAVFLTGAVMAAFMVMDNPSSVVLWVSSLLTGIFLSGVRAHQKSTRAVLLASMVFGVFALFKAARLFL